jgi:hypothetical protein
VTTGASHLPLRAGAGLAAVLAGWLALDSLQSAGLRSGGAGGLVFVLAWGLPLAALSAFLAWVALRGGDPGVRRIARAGCAGALLAGGGVTVMLLASALVLPWDALRGAVAAVQLAPLAGMLGGLGGLGAARMRERRR